MTVLSLIRDLVAIPSRGGIDPYDPIASHVQSWLLARGLPARRLTDPDGTTVAVTCEIAGAHPGPRWVLDACLDTAPFGDEDAWTHPPTSPAVVGGWLHGRGSADSKAAVAIFCHVAASIAARAGDLHGSLVLLFDLDEHTGGFACARTYFAAATGVAGVLIGYPGLDHLVVGGRGVHRADLHVYGVAAHSGGSRPTPNAVAKAADLVAALSAVSLGGADPAFPMGARLSVTAIHGGAGYSVTPDRCVVSVDVRTTPGFPGPSAGRLLADIAAEVDSRWPGTRPSSVRPGVSWPPYALDPAAPLPSALLAAAAGAGLELTPKVAGPSNIGNYLAGLGIPATAGFGVDHRGLHATDERLRIDSIPPVLATYEAAVRRLLGPRRPPAEPADPGREQSPAR